MKHRLQLFFSFVISWLVVTSSSPSAYSWNNRSVKEHLTVFIHKIPNRIWPYFFQLEYNRTGVKFRFVVTTSAFAQLWRCGLVLPSVEQLVSALQTRFLLMQKRQSILKNFVWGMNQNWVPSTYCSKAHGWLQLYLYHTYFALLHS